MASKGGAAYGDGAVATGSLATALGPNASTTAANAVAIGSGSIADEDDSVSMGALATTGAFTTSPRGPLRPTPPRSVKSRACGH